MKVETIAPLYMHLRTIPLPIGSIVDCDDWKGKEWITEGLAIEHTPEIKKKLKKNKPLEIERDPNNPELQ